MAHPDSEIAAGESKRDGAITTVNHETRSYDSAALVAGDERMWNAVSDWVAAVLPGARGGQAAN